VKGWLLLDIVVSQGSSVFKLFSSEDKSLLIGGDSFLVLDFCFDILNRVRGFNIKGNGFSSQSFNKDLHSTSKSQDQVKGWLLLDIVVSQGSSVFKLFSSEDKSLLIGRNSFFVLDFGFDILNGVRWLNIKGNGFSSQSLDENLHSTSKSQDQVKSGFFLDIVVSQCSSIFQLLTCEDKSLLIGGNSFFVLDFGFDVFNWVTGLNIKGNSFSGKGFYKDLHFYFVGLFKD